MIFNLEGYKVNFNERFISYNKLRNEYLKISEEIYSQFISKYEINCKTIEDVNSKALNIAEGCLEIAINKAIEKLINNNLITVDKDTFINKYCYKPIMFEEDFEEINNRYRKFLMSNEQEKVYRDEIKKALANSVKRNCFEVHFSIIDALIENGMDIYDSYPTSEMEAKSKALLNNLKTGFIPKENNEAVIDEIIKNNPYNIDVYLYLLDKCGNRNNEIVEITEFLGLDIKVCIGKLVDNYFINVEKSTEEETYKAIEKFKEYAQSLNYNDISKYLIMFDNLLKQHDINIRTVDGILFEQREEADIAKLEFEKILEIKENVSPKNEAIIKEAINKINEQDFKTIIKDRHLIELEIILADSIIFADQILLNDKYNVNRKFATEEEVDATIEELQALEIRTISLKKERIRIYENIKAKIIEKEEKILLDNYLSKYIILTEMDLDFVKEKIRILNLRTEKLKEDKINDLEFKGIFIIKNHNSQLEKAIKYEQRRKSLKEVKTFSKSGFLGMINKVIEKGSNIIEDMQEKSEREAWNFITDGGNRTIEDVKEGNYTVIF